MPLKIDQIKALCFDVDGTLSDTDDRWVQRLGSLLQPLRWLLPRRDPFSTARFWIMAAESPGNLLYTMADRFGVDGHIGQLFYRLNRESRHPTKHWIIPGVKECLAHLALSFPLAVVSARGEKSTLDFLDQFQLTPFFSAIATAQTCEYTKPFPDPVLWAANQMQVPPQNCLMIGDTTVDIKAGKRAGAQTVGVLCGFGVEKELREMGADMILPSTSHLQFIFDDKQPESGSMG